MNDLITMLDVLIIAALIFTNLVLLCVSSYLFYYITTLRELNAQLQKEYDRIRVNDAATNRFTKETGRATRIANK